MKTNVIEQLNQKVKEAIADAVVAAGLVTREDCPVFVLEVPKEKSHQET